MKYNIELVVDNFCESFMMNFLNDTKTLNINQTLNLSNYLQQASKTSPSSVFITNRDEILHAINYDSDENNDYWIILDINYIFYDINLPHVIDLSNNSMLNNLSEHEIKLVKLLK